MKTKYIITALLFGFVLTAFSGCSLLRKRVEKTEKVEFKLNAAGKTRLSVEDSNGDIKITRTDDTLGFVIIEAEKSFMVKYDEQDKPIENVKINIDTTGSIIKVETEITRNNGLFKSHRGGEVNYNIKVPSNIAIEIDNTNGDITLTRIDSDINIETVNSSMNLVKCSGSITINGVNGGVQANIDSTKGINIEMVNGTVKLGGLKTVSADVNANTVNGRIKFNNLSFNNLSAEKKSLTGTLGDGKNSIKISTVNGNITFDANQVSYKKDNNFNFKIDFDDDGDLDIYEHKEDDEPDMKETKDDAKTHEKTDTSKLKDNSKNADSLKRK